jgi:hypothetical protein
MYLNFFVISLCNVEFITYQMNYLIFLYQYLIFKMKISISQIDFKLIKLFLTFDYLIPLTSYFQYLDIQFILTNFEVILIKFLFLILVLFFPKQLDDLQYFNLTIFFIPSK